MVILGLETSCDETAVGIVTEDGRKGRVLANCVTTQLTEHEPFGGVVPEIAARAHLDYLGDLLRKALSDASLTFDDLDGIAATCGPGLIGGVMVGSMTGKAIAAARSLPFIGINHLEAHALTPRLSDGVDFPYLLLLVSGGHCQLLLARGIGDYRRLGSTIDDAVGECFDKSAKLLGLGYPGGPAIERAALNGDPKAFDLPRPLLNKKTCDFSFSGLKTAVRKAAEQASLSAQADLASSLQAAITDILVDRTRNALNLLGAENTSITSLVVAGGVAANQQINARLRTLAAEHDLPFKAPPPSLCTDNGAMVAWAGLEHLRKGSASSLDMAARPRWPLEALPLTASPSLASAEKVV